MRFVRIRGDPPDTLDVEALRDAVDLPGVRLAVLFGSYARDGAGNLSDLDVGIRLERDVERGRKHRLLDELTVAIQRATGVEAVDLVDLDSVGPELGYEALAEGVLVTGDPGEAADLEAEFMLKALDFRPIKHAWGEALDDRIQGGTFGRP